MRGSMRDENPARRIRKQLQLYVSARFHRNLRDLAIAKGTSRADLLFSMLDPRKVAAVEAGEDPDDVT